MKISRWIVMIPLLVAALNRLGAQEEEFTDLIELSLGYGFGFPSVSGLWLDTGRGGITQGVITDDLIHRVFIQRQLAERIFLDLDYDSDRQGGLFQGQNVYSLQYKGLEDEFLQEISAGNRYLSVPDTRLISIDQGNASSYALRTRMGTDRLEIEGLLRYSQAASDTKRFRGSNQLVESELLDVEYVKRRFFFVPDNEIDEDSLLLLRSSEVPADRSIDGKDFTLLVRGRDYTFDNSTGWIYLNRALYEEEELLVYYEKGGTSVGDAALGTLAIIGDDGVRTNFNSGVPGYFSAVPANKYLYLSKQSFNSYWEIKSAYYLQEVYSGVYPEDVAVHLLSTATGEGNDNYDALLDSYILDSDHGALIFTFEDGSGFYPRPFPGELPFAPPYVPPNPANPFDPSNPIYGGTEDPEAEVSINRLEINYTVSLDSYFLDFDIIAGSVEVTIDGRFLSAAYFTVDYYSGVITFAEGVVGPSSDIEITYRYTPLAGGNQELLLALGLDYDLEWLQLRNLTSFNYPLEPPIAPLVGEERGSVLGNSTDVIISLGAAPEEQGLAAEVKAGAAVALSNGNPKRRAIVADMEEIGLTSLEGDGGTIENASDHFSRIEEVAAGEPEVGTDAFSLQYPDVYAELHGSDSYRDRHGHGEQVLIFDFDPIGAGGAPLAAGQSVYLVRQFGYLVDLRAYKALRVYLFLPVGETIPADAGFPLVLVGSAAERLEITIPGTSIVEGWNELVVDLEAPHQVRLNGTAAGSMSRAGSADPLPRISEIRLGVLAGATDISSAFTFWLDEWHLAESRYSFDVALYGETLSGYRGELAFLTDPFVSAGFEHREGIFLDALDRRRDSWFAGFDTTLLKFVPIGVDLSGYRESEGGLFQDPAGTLPGGLEEKDTGWSYAHLFGLDTSLPFLPTLEHIYQRGISEDSEVGLSTSGYLYDSTVMTKESLSFTEAFRYPQWLEQRYSYTRSWLYTDQETLLIDTPPVLEDSSLDLAVNQSHSGGISFFWDKNFLSLDLSRDENYEVAAPALPTTLFASYAERMSTLFRRIDRAHPGAELLSREDRGALFINFPRQKHIGAILSMDSSFRELNFESGTGNRDLSVEDSLSLSLPFSPGGKGILQLIPKLNRSFGGSYHNTTDSIQELEILGQSWKTLLMPPFYYLNPRFDRGRLQEYEAVDLFTGSTEVLGVSEARLQTSLELEARLKDPPWFLPSRSRLSVAGETSREGRSYAQARTIELGLGTDFSLKGGGKTGANRLSFDVGWESGRDYADKIVSHSLTVDTGLELLEGIRGRLTGDHSISFTTKRQRVGDANLLLFPGQPGREVEVPLQPDKDTVTSVLGLEYSWEKEVDPKRQELLATSSFAGRTGRITHSERLELENTFLIAERTKLSDTTVVPLRLLFSHNTVMTVSQYMDLELSVKTIGGVEEIITSGESSYQPALGFELRFTAVLNF
jgi:hypothetical protein